MAYVEEYFAAFAGFGMLALLVLHPTLWQTVVGGLVNLVTRVTDLGSH
jgi:hypothetical protein